VGRWSTEVGVGEGGREDGMWVSIWGVVVRVVGVGGGIVEGKMGRYLGCMGGAMGRGVGEGGGCKGW
jgi:hypothetical protein